jgi:hypothetical protein
MISSYATRRRVYKKRGKKLKIMAMANMMKAEGLISK